MEKYLSAEQIKNLSRKGLRRLHIDEKKSVEEIAEIIGCCVANIRRRLKEYNIPYKKRIG